MSENSADRNHLDDLLVEYQVCSNMVSSSGNDCWLAGTLFIGAAFTGLVLLLVGGPDLSRCAVLGVTVGVVVVLLALKAYFINEEWRQQLCYERMRSIEQEPRLNLRVITEMRRRTRTKGSLLWWSRFPWKSDLRPLPEDVEGREDVKRRAFGWEFLHSSAWIAILMWVFLCWGFWWEWNSWLWLLLFGILALSVFLGQWFPISGVRLCSRSKKETP